jgi:hypothetical protein
MNKEQIWNELGKIYCTSKYVGDIEGLEVCENCDEKYLHIFNDLQSALIPRTEIQNVFNKLESKCGLRTFWDTVRDNDLCKDSEHIPD